MSYGLSRSTGPSVNLYTNAHHSYDTLIRRWPVILTTIIDHLYRVGHDLATQPNDLSQTVAEEQIAASKAIIEKISKLKYEMGREKPLLYAYVYQLFIAPASATLELSCLA